jgi:putative transposase
MAGEPVAVERGLLTVGAKAWELAARRAAVIGPLAERETVGLATADAAAAELGVSRTSAPGPVKIPDN